ncbi:MAG: 50S ribosomal protein L6 [Candidatus Levybacteria bacterium]|nr:50S ribosomal protein L6 [Candidatus Levybacteria bacterium]
MSKIGKQPIVISEGVTVNITGDIVRVSGQKGEERFTVPSGIGVSAADGKLVVSQTNKNNPEGGALSGLTRALLANMVRGVASGFEKKLELSGVGYRAQVQGQDLVLSLGFSHSVKITPPPGITFSVGENIITISGHDKALVGNTAARIRAVRPPEPYKGKGIKYIGERIRRKAGKAVKAVGTK